MAGRPPKVEGQPSKADLIREYFGKHGNDIAVKDVVAGLKQKGHVVQPAQVSMLRAKLQGGGAKNGKPRAPRKVAVVAARNEIADLQAAKTYVDSFGGDDTAAKKAIDNLVALR